MDQGISLKKTKKWSCGISGQIVFLISYLFDWKDTQLDFAAEPLVH